MPYHFLSVCIKFLSNFPIELTAQHIEKVIDSMKNEMKKMIFSEYSFLSLRTIFVIENLST